MRRREINFRELVVIWMPYILLKFLVKEKLLTEFLNKCDEQYQRTYKCAKYLSSLAHVCNKTHATYQLSIDEKKRLYKICFNDAFEFNNYWHRRFWEFEKFLDDYEEYIK